MLKTIATALVIAFGAVTLVAQTSGPGNGYLVIHGGGGGAVCFEDVARPLCEEHLDEFVRLGGGRAASIVIIPSAALFEELPPPAIPLAWSSRPLEYDEAFRERYRNMFRQRGVTSLRFLHTTSRVEADTDTFIAPLKEATAVWFIGGRQWIVADTYLDTRTETALHDLLDRGGVIGGGSAGAAIQASYLVRSEPRGNLPVMGERERGFGFIRNAAIDIHLLSWNRHFDLLDVIEKHPDLLGIGIDADAAIVVHGDEFRVIGVGSVGIYDAKYVVPDRKFYFLERGERFDLATRTPLTASGRRLRIPAILAPIAVRAETWNEIAGAYDAGGMVVRVFADGTRLFAEVAPGDRRELIPVAEDVFVEPFLGSEVTFQRDEAGRISGFEWRWPRCVMTAVRAATLASPISLNEVPNARRDP